MPSSGVVTMLLMALCVSVAQGDQECYNDGDCSYGVCVDYFCVDCRNKYDCHGDDTCVYNNCVECVDNSECPDNNVCEGGSCVLGPVCPEETPLCEDPHMDGLRGQTIDWSGVDGGWYSLVRDDEADFNVNLRVTAPLPQEFPDRQLITGISVLTAGHSLVIEVRDPYTVETAPCPAGISPCLANGGLRAVVDGVENQRMLTSLRRESVADGITVSASNLPVECRQFGGDKIWATMYEEMVQGRRELSMEERFEDWVLMLKTMAAPDWCAKYMNEHDLADVQSSHAVFKIVTAAASVRLHVGTNYQGNGELNWDGRVLPDLEFWQMNVGIDGLVLEHESLTGLLGETARPVLDQDGNKIMHGFEAFRGSVEDYRVDGALGTDFALLHQ